MEDHFHEIKNLSILLFVLLTFQFYIHNIQSLSTTRMVLENDGLHNHNRRTIDTTNQSNSLKTTLKHTKSSKLDKQKRKLKKYSRRMIFKPRPSEVTPVAQPKTNKHVLPSELNSKLITNIKAHHLNEKKCRVSRATSTDNPCLTGVKPTKTKRFVADSTSLASKPARKELYSQPKANVILALPKRKHKIRNASNIPVLKVKPNPDTSKTQNPQKMLKLKTPVYKRYTKGTKKPFPLIKTKFPIIKEMINDSDQTLVGQPVDISSAHTCIFSTIVQENIKSIDEGVVGTEESMPSKPDGSLPSKTPEMTSITTEKHKCNSKEEATKENIECFLEKNNDNKGCTTMYDDKIPFSMVASNIREAITDSKNNKTCLKSSPKVASGSVKTKKPVEECIACTDVRIVNRQPPKPGLTTTLAFEENSLYVKLMFARYMDRLKDRRDCVEHDNEENRTLMKCVHQGIRMGNQNDATEIETIHETMQDVLNNATSVGGNVEESSTVLVSSPTAQTSSWTVLFEAGPRRSQSPTGNSSLVSTASEDHDNIQFFFPRWLVEMFNSSDSTGAGDVTDSDTVQIDDTSGADSGSNSMLVNNYHVPGDEEAGGDLSAFTVRPVRHEMFTQNENDGDVVDPSELEANGDNNVGFINPNELQENSEDSRDVINPNQIPSNSEDSRDVISPIPSNSEDSRVMNPNQIPANRENSRDIMNPNRIPSNSEDSRDIISPIPSNSQDSRVMYPNQIPANRENSTDIMNPNQIPANRENSRDIIMNPNQIPSNSEDSRDFINPNQIPANSEDSRDIINPNQIPANSEDSRDIINPNQVPANRENSRDINPNQIPANRENSRGIMNPNQIPANRESSRDIMNPNQIPANRENSRDIINPNQIATNRENSRDIMNPNQIPANRENSGDVINPKELLANSVVNKECLDTELNAFELYKPQRISVVIGDTLAQVGTIGNGPKNTKNMEPLRVKNKLDAIETGTSCVKDADSRYNQPSNRSMHGFKQTITVNDDSGVYCSYSKNTKYKEEPLSLMEIYPNESECGRFTKPCERSGNCIIKNKMNNLKNIHDYHICGKVNAETKSLNTHSIVETNKTENQNNADIKDECLSHHSVNDKSATAYQTQNCDMNIEQPLICDANNTAHETNTNESNDSKVVYTDIQNYYTVSKNSVIDVVNVLQNNCVIGIQNDNHSDEMTTQKFEPISKSISTDRSGDPLTNSDTNRRKTKSVKSVGAQTNDSAYILANINCLNLIKLKHQKATANTITKNEMKIEPNTIGASKRKSFVQPLVGKRLTLRNMNITARESMANSIRNVPESTESTNLRKRRSQSPNRHFSLDKPKRVCHYMRNYVRLIVKDARKE